MSVSVLDMSMSLDGFISGPNDGPGNPGGDGFAPLHAWGFTPQGEFRRSGPAGEMNAFINAAGAVVSGRRTAEQVGHWGGVHHGDGIPVFIPSHRPPDPSVARFPLMNYVADGIVSAMEQAKAAAVQVVDTPQATHLHYRVRR